MRGTRITKCCVRTNSEKNGTGSTLLLFAGRQKSCENYRVIKFVKHVHFGRSKRCLPGRDESVPETSIRKPKPNKVDVTGLLFILEV